MPNTARGAFPFPLGGDTPDVVRDITALANRLAAVGAIYVQGLSGARPAANSQGGSGFFYYSTDTAMLSYSDGAAWHDVNPASTQTFLDAPGQAFQEGVLFGGVVTRIDPTTVRVSAGAAWIDGDSIAGFGSGRYFVTWPQTDITGIPAEAGADQRLDQFIVQLTGSAFAGTCSVLRLPGGSQAGGGVTISNRLGATAVPNGAMRLSDLIIDVGGVPVLTMSNSRDRRPWARGARYLYEANGLADYSTSSASYVDIDNVNLSPRLEIASGLYEVELDCVLFGTGSFFFAFDRPQAVNGGNSSQWAGTAVANPPASADDFDARKSFRMPGQCAPGSQRFNVRWAVNGGNPTLKRAAGYPLSFLVREIIGPSANNGMG